MKFQKIKIYIGTKTTYKQFFKETIHIFNSKDLSLKSMICRMKGIQKRQTTCRLTDLQTYRLTGLQTYLQTYRPTYLQTYRPTYLQTYRLTHLQTYTLTDLTDLQTLQTYKPYSLTHRHSGSQLSSAPKYCRLLNVDSLITYIYVYFSGFTSERNFAVPFLLCLKLRLNDLIFV